MNRAQPFGATLLTGACLAAVAAVALLILVREPSRQRTVMAATLTADMAPPEPQPAASARDILDRMTQRYATATSYAGRGVLLTYRQKSERFTSVLSYVSFEVRFRRPDRFRLDFTTEHPFPPARGSPRHNVVWWDGRTTIDYFLGRERRPERLDLGLANADIPSTITKLVLGKFDTRLLEDAALAGEEPCRGGNCYVITGRNSYGENRLWISKADFQLWKHRTRHEPSGGWIREETHQDVRLDQPIAEEALSYRTPRGRLSWPFAAGVAYVSFGLVGLWRRRSVQTRLRWPLLAIMIPILLPALIANVVWLLGEGGAYRDLASIAYSAGMFVAIALVFLGRRPVTIGARFYDWILWIALGGFLMAIEVLQKTNPI